MCCNKTIEYTVIPNGSYAVLRGCAGCGRKARFESTEKFRVNANGGRLDVWMIYACAHCGHTYNLPIFERVRVSDLLPEQYARHSFWGCPAQSSACWKNPVRWSFGPTARAAFPLSARKSSVQKGAVPTKRNRAFRFLLYARRIAADSPRSARKSPALIS